VPVGFYVPPKHLIDVHHLRDGRPTHGRWQVGGMCYVDIGRPWQPPPPAAGEQPSGHLRRATDELMCRIGVLARRAEARGGS
jgi:hypothetical protein